MPRILVALLCLGWMSATAQNALAQSSAQSTTQSSAPLIDPSKAPAPLFDDPVWHGATDPFVIWLPKAADGKGQWFMYYTQRRASLPGPNGVNWVHGSAIGIAISPDGVTWTYQGTAKGDHDLTEPLAAKGLGPEPGITWWAPGFVYDNGTLHMYVTLVDGVYRRWTGKRNIVHFTSDDGVNFKYASTATLSSDRVIDASVYQVNDIWYLVYKDEAAGSRTFRADSRDMDTWTHPVQVSPDGSQEAPWVFRWKNQWWLIVDGLGDKGLRIYTCENGIDGWNYVTTLLADRDGRRPSDNNVAHHPAIVVQRDGEQERCIVYYFTHQKNRTVMQLAEIEMGADGKPVCDRNK